MNDEYSDGITNEEAGIDEEDPSYQEDAYDTEELENFGQDNSTEESTEEEAGNTENDSGDTADEQ